MRNMNSTKATLLALASLIPLSGAANAALPSWAQNGSGSGQFEVQGSVDAICVIEVSDLAFTLDLQEGETAAKVATISESCNSGGGYTISFSSLNLGMQHSTDASRLVPYSLNYDGAVMSDLSAGLALTRSGEGFEQQFDVIINVSGDYERIAGNYKDVISVTIEAN